MHSAENNHFDEIEMEERISPFSIDQAGWISLIIGLILAIVVACYSPLFQFISHYFKTLVHEIGHSLFAVSFGYPSLPAFDFQYGGGFAPTNDRRLWLLIVDYSIIFSGFCLFCKRIYAVLLLVIFTIIYSVLAFTKSHLIIYYFMGHGFELVIAGIFLYRAISGTAILNTLERPLYALIAFFIIISDTKFAYLLVTDKTSQILYGFGKGGHPHDFTVIANDYLQTSLKMVALAFLACCIVTPLLTFGIYFSRGIIGRMISMIFYADRHNLE